MLRDEARMHETRWCFAWIARFLEILVCYIVFYRGRLQRTFIDAPSYVQSMRAHTDYRKFDDMIRQVVDCTKEQADEVEEYLQSLHEKKLVYYGTQRSKNALMTCLLRDTTEGQHIHFVDGDMGGYALAAKQMKQQMMVNGVERGAEEDGVNG